ncbi:MAG TPA: DUF692 family protein [Thiobacillus sp.]|nr:DUF692 family protein [Thiobacillus sp.]
MEEDTENIHKKWATSPIVLWTMLQRGRLKTPLHGAGLGLRRALIPDLKAAIPDAIDFFELAPENGLDRGSAWHRGLHHCAERRPIVAHGAAVIDPVSDLRDAQCDRCKRDVPL